MSRPKTKKPNPNDIEDPGSMSLTSMQPSLEGRAVGTKEFAGHVLARIDARIAKLGSCAPLSELRLDIVGEIGRRFPGFDLESEAAGHKQVYVPPRSVGEP